MYRKQIITKFQPFLNPGSIDSMLIGNDLDAILSAVYLHHRFGWEIIGLYDLKAIYNDSNTDIRQKIREKKIIAVDLDIYHHTLPSIGHHILQLKSSDILSGFFNSLNPNLLRHRTKENYRYKYPLGTIHLLRWLFEDAERSDDFEMLCWLADSSFINAQKYRQNVEEWLQNFLKSGFFLKIFQQTNTLAFEEKMKAKILPELSEINLDNHTSMTGSEFLKIKGFQTRIRNPQQDRPEIIKLLKYIAAISGMKIPGWPENFNKIPGNRTNVDLGKILKKYKNFDDFLLKENIFSYALTYQNTLNYTRFEKQ